MGRSGPSQVGLRTAGRGPLFAPSTIANRGVSGILKTKPQSNYATHVSSGKFDVLDGLLEDKAAWRNQIDSRGSVQEGERKIGTDSTNCVASIALNTASKDDSSIPEWRRKCPRPEKCPNAAGSRAPNQLLRTTDLFGRTLDSAANRISCTFTRSWDQPQMADTGPLDYYPFYKQDFALGTIIRAVVHEEEFKNRTKPTPFTHSTGITNTGREHVTHGDFGPIYSENRFLIVVNDRPRNHYLAIPVYSHQGNGLARITHREEYVSVADHRHLKNCQQQSAHAPLVTEFLKDDVEELLPTSVAYASYPVSRKYGLPVQHQGRLDEESTKRLVAMYQKWASPYETDD